MLFVLDLKDQVVYILDPISIDSLSSKQPIQKYLNKIQRASTIFGTIMNIEGQWNENIYLWDHTFLNGVQIKIDN
jgi:hypothetical protein